jgi:glycosyltransferase involved in cell wall biosynthesis
MKISIVIPVYNCARWIRSAIQSAIDQTWPDKEIVVVDDGSTDGTPEICREFGKQLIFLTQDHRGGNAARNLGLARATGEWIQFLDADDYLLPEKLVSQLSTSRNDADVLCSPTVEERWVDGVIVDRQIRPFPSVIDWYALWISWTMPQTGGALWKAEALRKIGGWDETFRCNQEYELYFRAFRSDLRFVEAGEPYSTYRIWSASTVCRADHRAVIDLMTSLIDDFLGWLKEKNRLTPRYQQLAAQQFFRQARQLAVQDIDYASQYYKERKREGLISTASDVAPWKYKIALRCFGFALAERLARAGRG